ncbi:MAG: hypothetical protein JW837_15080 [Sedimentisphaerales bacterium]|nr:hypothetical protein [Sedimentisphaerales bacterium]
MAARNYNPLCQEAKLYYYDSLSGESCELIPESVRDHLEQCRDCRQEIEQLKIALSAKEERIKSKDRQNLSAITTMLELHFAYIDRHVTCKNVRPFLPGLLDPALEIRIPTPITVHLDNCRQCSEDLKAISKLNLNITQLYRLSRFFTQDAAQNITEYSEIEETAVTIAQRANSDIITIYHVDESAKTRQVGKPDDLYSGFPINVEVIVPKTEVEQPVVSIDFAAALKKKMSAVNLKPLLKVGFAAAAVILVSFMLLHDTGPVEAESIDEMYKAVEGTENIYIAQFRPDGTEPDQERWISNTLNISVNKTKNWFDLVNVKTGIRQSKNPVTNVIERIKLPDDILINVRQGMVGCLGLIPFNKVSDLPPDSEWIHVDNLPDTVVGFEVYDLIWKKPTNFSHVSYKRRCFINSKTSFPERIEVYQTSIGQSEFDLKTVFKIRSVDKDEIEKLIRTGGFSN